MPISNRPLQALCGAVLILLSGALYGQDDTVPGLLWVQYHSTDFQRISDAGIDTCVNMNVGTAFRDFSRLWIGMIRSPADAPVTFEAEADNGLRLFIGDQTVIDGWTPGGERQGTVTIAKDRLLRFRLEYFQDGGEGIMRLYWSWAGHPRELIPSSGFFYTGAQKAMVSAWAEELYADVTPERREDHSAVYGAAGTNTRWPRPQIPIPVFPGPHLFLGDYSIASSDNMAREVNPPQRDPSLPNPIVRAGEDRTFQPFFTVLRAPGTGRYRLWYGAWREDKSQNRSRLAYLESEDGIRWIRPMVLCDTPEIQFGAEVMDRGPDWPEPEARYIYNYWLEGGLRLLASPDGLTWKPFAEGVVLPHNHDINNLWRDPIRGHYVATISSILFSKRWFQQRRTTLQSTSTDLVHWSAPAYVLFADPKAGDQGKTEYYGMSAYLARGPLVIGMVKVLRDDLTAEGVEPGAFGMGYTTLAWSHDGVHWMRDLKPFFEPDPAADAWDHAHAWIDEQLVTGDTLRLYYGGYKQGHKMNRFEERQIGLLTMPVDRYVARMPETGKTGLLRTVPFTVKGKPSEMTVNADIGGGVLKVRIIDAATGRNIRGLSLAECRPVSGNGCRLAVQWGSPERTRRRLAALNKKCVCFEFLLEGNARLYAFELEKAAPVSQDTDHRKGSQR